MKFKLDENFGTRTLNIFQSSGHEITTVVEEDLQGCSDTNLYKICCEDKLCLVTLDLDFANVLRFAPQQAGGIAVIRVPRNPNLETLEILIQQLLEALKDMSIEGKLWVVEWGRIRIHQTEIED